MVVSFFYGSLLALTLRCVVVTAAVVAEAAYQQQHDLTFLHPRPRQLSQSEQATCTCPTPSTTTYVTLNTGYVTGTTVNPVAGATAASTTTLASPSGTVPGRVEVFTAVYCGAPASSTTTSPPSPGTANRGVSYAMYNQTEFNAAPFSDPNGFSNYKVGPFSPLLYTGRTNRIGHPSDPGTTAVKIYDDTPAYLSSYKAINHLGYIYARTAGTYSFNIVYSDDIVLVWTNTNAYSGYTRANANLVRTYDGNTAIVRTYSTVLAADTYLPFRIQWGDGGSPGGFTFNIAGPAGNILMDNTGSVDIVTKPCTGTYPTFAP